MVGGTDEVAGWGRGFLLLSRSGALTVSQQCVKSPRLYLYKYCTVWPSQIKTVDAIIAWRLTAKECAVSEGRSCNCVSLLQTKPGNEKNNQ